MAHSVIMSCVMLKRVSAADSPNPKLKWKSRSGKSKKDKNNVFFHSLRSSALPPTAILSLFFSSFNSAFVYLRSFLLSLHLPKGIYPNFAPHSESDMDYFIMGVYLAASWGLYGSCWTLVGIMRLRAER